VIVSTYETSVFVGPGLDAEALRRKLNSDSGSLLHGVGTSLIQVTRDERAVAYKVVVDEVHIDAKFSNQVQLDLVVSWSLYHGCKNMNQDDEYMSEGATYSRTGALIFNLPAPRRAPSGC
jgi:hypothetical protein